MEALQEFIQSLQACITPVAMISGVGLLLLTITNRMARTVDRTRQLIAELDKGITNPNRAEMKKCEILIFIERSRLLKNSVALLLAGMISSCLMIPIVFIMKFSQLDLSVIGYALFIIATTSMLIAFVYFFIDIQMSLKAIKLEAQPYI